MIRRPPRSTLDRSSAASDVYKRQPSGTNRRFARLSPDGSAVVYLSLIHISEPTRQAEISYAVFCLKKKKKIIGLKEEKDKSIIHKKIRKNYNQDMYNR